MKFVPVKLSRVLGAQSLTVQKNAPNALFYGGVAGMLGSTVLACRATLRLSDQLEEAKHDLDVANQIDSPEYSDMMRRKDVTRIYVRNVLSVGRLYAPAVLLGAASIAALTKSHNQLSERNLALTAAYATVDEAFEKYRSRVIEKYGVDEDRLLRFDTEEVQLVDDNGKTQTVTRVTQDPDGHSMYARWFDKESSTCWEGEPEYNYVYLRGQQNWFNDLLKRRGHVFLNEVYDALGMERTKAGAIVGWVVDGKGDGFIDFGLYDDQETVLDFFNGREGAILLDFNVDGVIYDQLEKRS